MDGHFYFLDDQYFVDFPFPELMQNKETINGVEHKRPCFLAFSDRNTGLIWLIPISSKIEKYRGIYDKKVLKYGRCDTIVFGNVLGQERAFLIQNMLPSTQSYITSTYIDKQTQMPVQLAFHQEREIIQKAKKVLTLVRLFWKNHKRSGVTLLCSPIPDIRDGGHGTLRSFFVARTQPNRRAVLMAMHMRKMDF